MGHWLGKAVCQNLCTLLLFTSNVDCSVKLKIQTSGASLRKPRRDLLKTLTQAIHHGHRLHLQVRHHFRSMEQRNLGLWDIYLMQALSLRLRRQHLPRRMIPPLILNCISRQATTHLQRPHVQPPMRRRMVIKVLQLLVKCNLQSRYRHHCNQLLSTVPPSAMIIPRKLLRNPRNLRAPHCSLQHPIP